MQQAIEQLLTRRPVILQLLRFAAIGVINTTLDFIIFNFLSKLFGVDAGLPLGVINAIGFASAVVQSYLWNRYWAFGSGQTVDLAKNFFRLIVVGGIGALGFLAVLYGAQFGAAPFYYLIALGLFLLAEYAAWRAFGIHQQSAPAAPSHQFLGFFIVSLIGLVINSALVAWVSWYLDSASLPAGLNSDLLKNVAKIVATIVSLVWNFVGYKVAVFKK